MLACVAVDALTVERGTFHSGIPLLLNQLAKRDNPGVTVCWLLRTQASTEAFNGSLVIRRLQQADGDNWHFTGTFQNYPIEGTLNAATGQGSFSELLPR